MVFNFFNKKPKDPTPSNGNGGSGGSNNGNGKGNGGGGNTATPGPEPQGYKPDPRAANKWFEHARAVADSRQHDYAITCYCNGLKFDPDNMIQHENLRDVALRRRVAGGKPAPIGEKMKSGGKTAVDRMLHAERIWSMEPLSLPLMIAVMERAVEAELAEPELNLAEFANWVGDMILEGPRDKPLKKNDLKKVRDLFRSIKVYDRAIQAAHAALTMDRSDPELMTVLRDIETEKTLRASQDRSDARKEGEFVKNVANMEQQTALDVGDRRAKTEDQADLVINARRADAAADPNDTVKQDKLADALKDKETDESQEEAIKIYLALRAKTNQYLYQEKADKTRINILNRRARTARKALEANPGDAKTAQDYQEQVRLLRETELEIATDRVKNYPTELTYKFKLGELLFLFKRYDEGIGLFQMTKIHPALRAASLNYLGKCYEFQGWFDEAVSAYNEAIQVYPIPNDKQGLEMRYNLMNVLDLAARKNQNPEQAQEAMKWGSQVLQNNINYRDIRDRMEKIRKFVSDFKSSGDSPGTDASNSGGER